MLVSNGSYVSPFFGDHVLVEFLVNVKKCKTSHNICRYWGKYSHELLNAKLANVDWDIKIDNIVIRYHCTYMDGSSSVNRINNSLVVSNK